MRIFKKYQGKIIFLIAICAFFCFFGTSTLAKDTIKVGEENLAVHVLQKATRDNEAFVLLFLGDGYIKDEQSEFLDHISVRTEKLLQKEPFKSYSDRINIYAVPTVSKESGVSYYDVTTVDTYYGITREAKAAYIREFGKEKAKAIRNALEEQYLDSGGVVGTIHILSNSDEYFGASENSLFSVASVNSQYSGGEATVHEIAHSIGKLRDEYGAVKDGVNASVEGENETLGWRKFLGFRGVGKFLNGQDTEAKKYFIPSLSCIMLDLGNPNFCEVCKTELATRMNLSLYTQKSERQYIAPLDITTEHKSVTGKDYEDIRINKRNIQNANGHDLELRTIIQNFEKKERNIKLSFKISDSSGNEKYYKEETFCVPPLSNEYDTETARKSISVVIEDVYGLVSGDKISGVVLDVDTNEVLSMYYPDYGRIIYKIKVTHKIKDKYGNITEPKNIKPTIIYVPKGDTYKIKNIGKINGGGYISNSLNSDEITADEFNKEVDFYYRPESEEKKTVSHISENGKSLIIKPQNIPTGFKIVAAFYKENKMAAVNTFDYDGNDVLCSVSKDYDKAKIMVFENLNSLMPECEAEKLNLSDLIN